MFFFLWIFSRFFAKETFSLICKNPFTSQKSPLKKDLIVGFTCWFLGAPLTFAVGQTADFVICLIFGQQNYEQVAVHLLKQSLHTPFLLFSTLFSVLITAPIIEEFLFRGLLQNFFKRYMTQKKAILLTAVFFSLIHLSLFQGLGNISLFLSLLTFGCFLGFVYEKQGSLLSSITLHATFNLLTTLQILLAS